MRSGKSRYLVMVLFLLASLVIPAAPASPVRADVSWTGHSSNPVFSQGVIAGAATVIYDEDTHLYKMWFTRGIANESAIDGLVGELLGLDLGNLIDDIRTMNWRGIAENDAANLKTAIDYLAGLSESELDDLASGSGGAIGYATSVDGVDWEYGGDVLQATGEAWDEILLGAPAVVRNSDGGYEMWYTGARFDAASFKTLLTDISLLTADDLQTLLTDIADKNLPGLISDIRAVRGDDYVLSTLIHFAQVVADAGISLGYATSADGIEWTKDASNPVLQGGTGLAWDRYGVAGPAVVRTGDSYEMWYTGLGLDYASLIGLLDATTISDVDTALRDGITIAIGRATSPDGVAWTRYGSAPVFQRADTGSW
ncbi:MAG: hypothetical protein HYX96_05700, partial [Chloroflexi bacterium]|nr:hypothetical protein [Chloroflexota bacterium]